MIVDTAGVESKIIRENEIGIYDTITCQVVYSCNGFIKLKTGEQFRLTNKEKIIEGINHGGQ